jgi:lipopolysaccharide export system protein LptA
MRMTQRNCSIFHLYLPALALSGFAMLLVPPVMADSHAEKSPVTIEASDFLEWNQSKGTYIAKGEAYIVQADADIRAEHIIATYNPDSAARDLTRVIATGDVLYNNGENSAVGEKLDYDIQASIYILTGKNARAAGPKGEMTATQSIKFDEKDINKRVVTAVGKARYKNQDGRVIFGDKLVALLDENGTLITIDAYDNSKVITEQGTTATADQINYIADTSLATLTGDVEINDREGNIMRGARAEIDFDKDISRMLSGTSGKRVSGVLKP